jgi:hypothetical protein
MRLRIKDFFHKLLFRRTASQAVPNKKKKPSEKDKPQKTKTPPTDSTPDPFLEALTKFEARLQQYWQGVMPPTTSEQEIVFLITPWVYTAVPMFSLELALQVRQAGTPVRLILDGTDLAGNAGPPSHTEGIARVIESGMCSIPVTLVATDTPKQPNDSDVKRSRDLFYANAVWWARGEAQVDEFRRVHALGERKFEEHLGRVRHLLSEMRPGRLIMPGGIFGVSSVYQTIAKELHIPFSTYDAGKRQVTWSHNGIAAHRADFGDAVRELDQTLEQHVRSQIEQIAEDELAKRHQVKDVRGYQMTEATGERYPYDIFVPLNVRWDSAALMREKVFSTFVTWLDEVLQWVKEHPPWSVCVREHPGQRMLVGSAESCDSYDQVIAKHADLGHRLRFVRVTDAINSYDVIRCAKVVLSHTSTLAMEATMLGVPVVVGSHCYYEDVGFVWKAENREQYFTLLEQALSDNLQVNERRRQLARLTYFLSQCCRHPISRFNPHPGTFDNWVLRSPEEIRSWNDFRSQFECLTQGRPLGVVVLSHLAKEWEDNKS